MHPYSGLYVSESCLRRRLNDMTPIRIDGADRRMMMVEPPTISNGLVQ